MGKKVHSEAIAIAARLASETAKTAVDLATSTAKTANDLMMAMTVDAGNLTRHIDVCAERDKALDAKLETMKADQTTGREGLKTELKKDIKAVRGLVLWVVSILTLANSALIGCLAVVAWTFFKSIFHIQG